MMRFFISKACLFLVLFLASPMGSTNRGEIPTDQDFHQTPAMNAAPSQPLRVNSDFGKMPLHFLPNAGHVDSRVAFYIRGKDKTVYFTADGVTFVLNSRKSGSQEDSPHRIEETLFPADRINKESPGLSRWAVKLDFIGKNPEAIPKGAEKSGAVISYLKGKPEDWHTGLPAYSRILYPHLWPGIDLVYYGTFDRLKYEFIVHPGADPAQIRLAYRGITGLEVDTEGRLAVKTPHGGFHDDVPIAFQEKYGKRISIPVAYAVETARKDGRRKLAPNPKPDNHRHIYGFQVGDYDRSLPLVLDPVILVYCGYIGGSTIDSCDDIAIDSFGNAYIFGDTRSSESSFPVKAGLDMTYNGNGDAFIAKLNASGTALIYCSYIGGSSEDYAHDISVDGSGNAFIVGKTESSQATFPVTVGPDLTYNGGNYDVFIAKVNASGTALDYCGYIGGSGTECRYSRCGITVDASGNAYVTGSTESSQATFPVTVGPFLIKNSGGDAFVAKVNASGTALMYCGYIGGGSSYDFGLDIAVDGSGNAYVTGYTHSSQAYFPVKVGPDLTYNGGNYDVFVAKVNAAGTALDYCGYIGGSGVFVEWGTGIAVDSSGNAYIVGETCSTEATFPVKVGPDLTYGGGAGDSERDAFVAKVNASGTALIYCGYIGGSDNDYGTGIVVDSRGNAYVTGSTYSLEYTFPVVFGPDLTHNGVADAYVAKVNASGTALVYCGYIGGSSYDRGFDIALDNWGYTYIAGETQTPEASFPVIVGPDLTHNGGYDGFVAKISPETGGFYIFDGHDFNGNGKSDISVWKSANGRWYIKGGPWPFWGGEGDTPVSGDYNGDNITDICVWKPANGRWYIRGQSWPFWGASGDIPVPGDYNGDGTTDIAVFRPMNGRWFIKDQSWPVWGNPGDIPVPGDYNGDGIDDVAVWRPTNGRWYIQGQVWPVLGEMGDIPVPADYDGDSETEMAVWRPLNGTWLIEGQSPQVWGQQGDIPVPGDYNGDGAADIAVFRSTNGRWYIKGQSWPFWGGFGDIPLVR